LSSILIDTGVLIEILRERDASIMSRWERLARDETAVAYSPVTVAEILPGMRKGEQARIEAAFSLMICLPIDADVGRIAGAFLRKFRSSHSLEIADALIAGTAVVHGVPLWTRNRKHYPMSELGLI